MVPRRSALKIQTHAMFLDTSFNSQSTVLANIYQNLTETAMKYYRYAKAMGGWRRLPTPLLRRECISESGNYSSISYMLLTRIEAYTADRDHSGPQ